MMLMIVALSGFLLCLLFLFENYVKLLPDINLCVSLTMGGKNKENEISKVNAHG